MNLFRRNRMIRLGLASCILLLGGSLAFGQGTTGTISGTVTDQTGAAVPGATVIVKNLETNSTRETISDEQGRYKIAGLPVGPYELTTEISGFGKYKRGPINLLLNQDAVI